MKLTRRQALATAAVSVGALACPKPNAGAGPAQQLEFDDVSRLNAVPVRKIAVPTSVDDVVRLVKESEHIIASGARHSQGGHNSIKDGVVIDMRSLARVISVDEVNKRVVVEAGAS